MIEFTPIDWGLIPYEQARKKQLVEFESNISKKLKGEEVSNILFMCEHKPVITFGKSASSSNLLFNKTWLVKKGIEVYETERGGDVTFHGPGQLVVYPHFDIEMLKIGVKEYVFKIEEVIIRTIADFGIEAGRSKGFTGVWLDLETPKERKIAAIGIKCSRGVTMHGLALNISTDLSYFNYIVPCGIEGKGVTSMEKELGREVNISEVKAKIVFYFSEIFGMNIAVSK